MEVSLNSLASLLAVRADELTAFLRDPKRAERVWRIEKITDLEKGQVHKESSREHFFEVVDGKPYYVRRDNDFSRTYTLVAGAEEGIPCSSPMRFQVVGGKLLYVNRADSSVRVVFGDWQSKLYDSMYSYRPQIREGKVFFVADRGDKQYIVHGDKEQQLNDGSSYSDTIDGMVVREGDEEYSIFCGNNEYGPHKGSIGSAHYKDGHAYYFTGRPSEQHFFFRDGEEIAELQPGEDFAFGDGLLAVVKKDDSGTMHMFWNGKEGPTYKRIGGCLTESPRILQGKPLYVGTDGTVFETIHGETVVGKTESSPTIQFLADGRIALKTPQYVMIDGKRYDFNEKDSFLRAHGVHEEKLIYEVELNGRRAIVWGTEQSQTFDQIEGVGIEDDHIRFWGLTDGEAWKVTYRK